MSWQPITIDRYRVLGVRQSDGKFHVLVHVLGDVKPEWARILEEQALVSGLRVEVDSEDCTIEIYVPDDPRRTTKQDLELCILEANQAFEHRLVQNVDDDSRCKKLENELNG